MTEDLTTWIDAPLRGHPELCRMGHNQRAEDLNLGLGWLYYGFARLIRPSQAVVIGSWRGFVPLVIAKACQDNLEPCAVHFIDPSLRRRLLEGPGSHGRPTSASFGLGQCAAPPAHDPGVRDHAGVRGSRPTSACCSSTATTRPSRRASTTRRLPDRLAPRGLVLFHDSMILKPSGIYGAGTPLRRGRQALHGRTAAGSRPAAARPAVRHRPDGPAQDRRDQRRTPVHRAEAPSLTQPGHRSPSSACRKRATSAACCPSCAGSQAGVMRCTCSPTALPAPGDIRRRAFVDLFSAWPLEAADAESQPVPCRYVSFAGHYAAGNHRRRPAARPGTGRVRHVRRHRSGRCRGARHSGHQRLRRPQRRPGTVLRVNCEAIPGWPSRLPATPPSSAPARQARHRRRLARSPMWIRPEPAPEHLLRAAGIPDGRGAPGLRADSLLRQPAVHGAHRHTAAGMPVTYFTSSGERTARLYFLRHGRLALLLGEALAAMEALATPSPACRRWRRSSASAARRRPTAMRADCSDRTCAWRSAGEPVGDPREADLFVTHHGLNSTHEAIFNRVPMLSYPFFWDQPGLAAECRPSASPVRSRAGAQGRRSRSEPKHLAGR